MRFFAAIACLMLLAIAAPYLNGYLTLALMLGLSGVATYCGLRRA